MRGCSSALVAQLAERTAVNREVIGSNPIRSVHTRLAQSVERWPFKPVAEGSSPSAGGCIILFFIIFAWEGKYHYN